MKQLFNIFLVTLIFAAVKCDNYEEMEKHMKAIGDLCAKEHGVSSEMIDAVMNGDMNAINGDQKCVAKCFLEKIEVIDAAGKINEAKVHEMVAEQPAMKDKIMECGKIQHANLCEQSFQMLGCVMALCHEK